MSSKESVKKVERQMRGTLDRVPEELMAWSIKRLRKLLDEYEVEHDVDVDDDEDDE